MEHTAGRAITIYLSIAIMNHKQSLDFAQRFLDTYDAIPVTGFSLLARFQKHRHFKYLPNDDITPLHQPCPLLETSIPCRLPEGTTGGYGHVSTIGRKQVRFADILTEVMVDLTKSPEDCRVGAPRFSQPHPTFPKKSKAKTKRSSLSFFFGNITIWGPCAQAKVFSDDFKKKFQVVGLVETHLTPANEPDLIARAAVQGYQASSNCAQQYDNSSGNHGGEAILTAKSTYSIPIDCNIMEASVSVNS
jgi:hypothetical protein